MPIHKTVYCGKDGCTIERRYSFGKPIHVFPRHWTKREKESYEPLFYTYEPGKSYYWLKSPWRRPIGCMTKREAWTQLRYLRRKYANGK